MRVNDAKYLTPENDNFGRKHTSSFTDTCDGTEQCTLVNIPIFHTSEVIFIYYYKLLTGDAVVIHFTCVKVAFTLVTIVG